ncbi:hypothetical protein [Kineococcus arenarius]|uniref:hypothetical protein n=1 Tax=unclassified Kineococcus TaxID=2621656 RepID=UPI003D7E0D83
MSTSAHTSPEQHPGPSRYEARCRALLRAYPHSWRREREAEILGVLLAMQNDDGGSTGTSPGGSRRQTPSWGVQADLIAGGVQARWERGWSFLPASIRDRVAVLATVLGAAACTVIVVFGEVAWPWLYPVAGDSLAPPLVQSPLIVVYGWWLLALISVLAGRATLARGFLAAAAVTSVILSATVFIFTAAPLAVAAALATIGRLPTGRSVRGWMAAAYILLTGALMLTQRTDDYGMSLQWSPAGALYQMGPGSALQDLSVGVVGVALVTGLLALAFRRSWVPAIVVTVVPYLYLGYFARYGGVQNGLVVSMLPVLLTAVVLLAVAGAVWRKHRLTITLAATPPTSISTPGQETRRS